MGCPSCGAENRPGRRFCGGCGAALPAACPSCAFLNEPDEKFCGGCGQRMAPSPAAPPPQSYTPRHLVDKILASRAGLEGERKQVTVLFADVVGSTELIRDLDPEDAQRLLDGAVTRMMAAVHRYEGTVSRALGDGIMALFGAPLAHEDHALRACYAALAMQAELARYAEGVRREQGVRLQARVGLNSGEVVVRLISDDLHMDYTALGQTVHLASRMEQVAAPGTAALTAETLALVEGYVQVRALGWIPVKGLSEPIEIFELLGAGDARTRLQAAAARGLSHFVGRRAEMEALSGALDRARLGHGQVAALVGEPGVGKSRLVWEVTHSHRIEGWLVLESGSVSYGRATSYLPVIDLLKAYCRIEGQDDERAIREKLRGKLLHLDEGLRPCLSPLLALLDVEDTDAAWEALDPTQRRRQMLDALKRLLLRESQEQPLLLVFEDLHWIDSESQALVDSLVESLPNARILLLVTYRPEYRHEWGNRGYYTQLRIDSLGEASADELLAGLLGDDASLDGLRALLVERTEGNPFFLEESVRSLVETGALAGERGAFRLPMPLATIRVPATVQAVLAARIDRLPAEEKRLLQVAAVIGKDVPFDLLRVVADIGDDALHGLLSRLQAAELLYEASLFPEPEYTFKHALTHGVAYGSLLQERRLTLHGQVLEAIERLYQDRLDEHAERLAHHAVQGEAWAQAVTYCRRAGEKADARSSNREATAHFDQALTALRHLPECRDTLEQAIDLRLNLRPALHALGEWARVRSTLHEAETIAERIGDQLRLGRIISALVNSYWRQGNHHQAVELGNRAIAVSEAIGSVGLRIYTNYALALTYRELGAYRQALDALAWNRRALSDAPVWERFGLAALPTVSCHAEAALCLSELGEFAQAIELGEESVRLAEDLAHGYSVILARQHLGHLYLRRGSADVAISVLERGFGLCRSLEVIVLLPGTAAGLGAAYTLAGRVSEGLPLLEEATREGPSHGTMAETSRQATWLGEAHLAVGHLEDADRIARWALDLAVDHDECGHRACALRFLGQIAACRAPAHADEAEARYHDALTFAEELEMRPLQAHCHLGLGKLYRRTGRKDEARAELATAVAMLREMGMAFWLPEAEGELAEVG
jgi:predicted ATPase/class 3 adenylate cyclase